MFKQTTSALYSLNKNDFLKGLAMATLVPVLLIVQQSLDSGQFTFNPKQLGMAAVGGFVAYLVKNFFTNGQAAVENNSTAEQNQKQ